ncbi:MAG: RpiB/LacA/LacB family sugar-phosphate isomerase [Prevotellaceae bacterium]|jgi:ribose 5-phosphate isomerase B|nr:RpiB/LacA/LacB family sugar-phosphate isomerase [Prevotellaceae bacterium]
MTDKLIIGVATDHAGYACKEIVRKYLNRQGFSAHDFGCFSTESADYPDTAHPLAEALQRHAISAGFAFCGTGNGMAMALNRHRGIRAGIAWTPELSEVIRSHNNANICVIPARYIEADELLVIVETFLQTDFEGGRHLRRIEKIDI